MSTNSAVDALEKNRHLRSRREVLAFDNALQALDQSKRDEDLPSLLKVFTDDCQDYEVMYGLVHLVESFENNRYFPALIEVLPLMTLQAADWLKTLHYGILNDCSCTGCYKKAYQAATPAAQEAARKLLFEIEADAPEFSARVRELIS